MGPVFDSRLVHIVFCFCSIGPSLPSRPSIWALCTIHGWCTLSFAFAQSVHHCHRETINMGSMYDSRLVHIVFCFCSIGPSLSSRPSIWALCTIHGWCTLSFAFAQSVHHCHRDHQYGLYVRFTAGAHCLLLLLNRSIIVIKTINMGSMYDSWLVHIVVCFCLLGPSLSSRPSIWALCTIHGWCTLSFAFAQSVHHCHQDHQYGLYVRFTAGAHCLLLLLNRSIIVIETINMGSMYDSRLLLIVFCFCSIGPSLSSRPSIWALCTIHGWCTLSFAFAQSVHHCHRDHQYGLYVRFTAASHCLLLLLNRSIIVIETINMGSMYDSRLVHIVFCFCSIGPSLSSRPSIWALCTIHGCFSLSFAFAQSVHHCHRDHQYGLYVRFTAGAHCLLLLLNRSIIVIETINMGSMYDSRLLLIVFCFCSIGPSLSSRPSIWALCTIHGWCTLSFAFAQSVHHCHRDHQYGLYVRFMAGAHCRLLLLTRSIIVIETINMGSMYDSRLVHIVFCFCSIGPSLSSRPSIWALWTIHGWCTLSFAFAQSVYHCHRDHQYGLYGRFTAGAHCLLLLLNRSIIVIKTINMGSMYDSRLVHIVFCFCSIGPSLSSRPSRWALCTIH